MKLPNSEKAFIPEAKLKEYLLSPMHPEGGPKSIFFEAIGFSKSNSLDLATALLSIAQQGEISKSYDYEFGSKFIVEGSLLGKRGNEFR